MTFLHQWAKESPICVILFILQCSREKMPKHYKSNMIEHVRSIFLKINEQDERLEKHENMLQENADLIKGVDKRVGDLEKIANSQLIWRIEDYTRKLKEAKAGNGDTLFSPTFTTSKHGYRLCASVCLNGDGKGKGSHMSVFISVLRGEKRFSTWITHSRFPAHYSHGQIPYKMLVITGFNSQLSNVIHGSKLVACILLKKRYRFERPRLCLCLHYTG